MSEPPNKKRLTPGKKVSNEWYQSYQSKAFVHATEFDEAKIHTHSYSVKIGHLKGDFNVFFYFGKIELTLEVYIFFKKLFWLDMCP